MEFIYLRRHRIASLVTGMLIAMLTIAGIAWVAPRPPPAPPGPQMRVMLTAPAPPSLAAPEEPPPPPRVKDDQFIAKPVKQRERREPAPPVEGPTVADAPPSPLPPGPPSAPQGREIQSLEDAYVAAMRAHLESIKRYPTEKEARIQQPQGTVTLVFHVSRGGDLVGVEVSKTAGSILDRAAMATVRRARFAPFPNEAWAGEGAHRFEVELEFKMS